MRTIRTKVYQFSELSESAKQNAIEHHSDINVDSEHWFSSIYDDAEEIGLKITEFDFDSASFVRDVQGNFLLSANEVAQNIFNNHGEHCKTYKTAESFMGKWQPVFDTYMKTERGENKLLDIEDKFLNNLLTDYKKMLQEQYEYEASEEAIIETIEANNYEFTKDGKPFYK